MTELATILATIRELEQALACIRLLEAEKLRQLDGMREAEAEYLIRKETSMGQVSWAWKNPYPTDLL